MYCSTEHKDKHLACLFGLSVYTNEKRCWLESLKYLNNIKRNPIENIANNVDTISRFITYSYVIKWMVVNNKLLILRTTIKRIRLVVYQLVIKMLNALYFLFCFSCICLICECASIIDVFIFFAFGSFSRRCMSLFSCSIVSARIDFSFYYTSVFIISSFVF